VLTNLLGNAVKFTPSGAVSVRCGVAEGDDIGVGGGVVTLRFDVEDTDIGIDPDVVSHLFQPFTQADSSMTRRYGGTGLGLSICRQLVRMMGDEIGSVPSTWPRQPDQTAREAATEPSHEGRHICHNATVRLSMG
jgi:two-component system sensor histidine kinase/response regulator